VPAGEHFDPEAASGIEPSALPTEAMPTRETTGSMVGSYHLLERIGEGGMGEVWLAEQKEPVCRRVAVKLIKAGMDTREVVSRFESERQALALMDHPGIAKVFDAGSTKQGRPYFVTEYVNGIPITAYCDKHRLTTRQRLELFVTVCEGVQHAHQKAILHRDLKPSNILVSEVDGKPLARIIDFGVAKATSQRLTPDTMFTRVGEIIGTLAYMSPEQADSAGTDVDTRTDVYSLGVVLYELLAGALPLEFGKTPPDEFVRKLRDEDAPRPSTKVRTHGEQSGTVAQFRGVDSPTLARLLRGDLDAIALKALEKDRSRRYASPAELAADVGRFLGHRPVLARPAGPWYLASKYIRRHRVAVGATSIVVALLVAFAVTQAVELRRVRRERDRADRITQFMTDMFKVSDPSEARGNDIRAREILDKASKGIATGLANDPELQAQMMNVMGNVYVSLGLFSSVLQV
jgi:eukaryotic-like serine/threonine-protein kinase